MVSQYNLSEEKEGSRLAIKPVLKQTNMREIVDLQAGQ